MGLVGRCLWERRGTIGAFLGFCCVFAVSFWLYRLPVAAVLYPAGICALAGVLLLAREVWVKVHRHRELLPIRREPNLLLDEVPEPLTLEAQDLLEIARELKSQLRQLEQESDRRAREATDYYTVWAHQIKTPIAAMQLALQNEDTPLARRLTADLLRIEQYVSMVLAYLRLDAPATDYVFRETDVDGVCRAAIARFAAEFIDRKLRVDFSPTGIRTVTDEKWLSFVLEQLLSNALKYTRSGGIRLYAWGETVLCMEDTGTGIAPEDLPRIFEKGFTGLNGRQDQKASGLGLYLCSRVCENLGLRIWVESSVGVGTRVFLDFAQYPLRPE